MGTICRFVSDFMGSNHIGFGSSELRLFTHACASKKLVAIIIF